MIPYKTVMFSSVCLFVKIVELLANEMEFKLETLLLPKLLEEELFCVIESKKCNNTHLLKRKS